MRVPKKAGSVGSRRGSQDSSPPGEQPTEAAGMRGGGGGDAEGWGRGCGGAPEEQEYRRASRNTNMKQDFWNFYPLRNEAFSFLCIKNTLVSFLETIMITGCLKLCSH